MILSGTPIIRTVVFWGSILLGVPLCRETTIYSRVEGVCNGGSMPLQSSHKGGASFGVLPTGSLNSGLGDSGPRRGAMAKFVGWVSPPPSNG